MRNVERQQLVESILASCRRSPKTARELANGPMRGSGVSRSCHRGPYLARLVTEGLLEVVYPERTDGGPVRYRAKGGAA